MSDRVVAPVNPKETEKTEAAEPPEKSDKVEEKETSKEEETAGSSSSGDTATAESNKVALKELEVKFCLLA